MEDLDEKNPKQMDRKSKYGKSLIEGDLLQTTHDRPSRAFGWSIMDRIEPGTTVPIFGFLNQF